MSNDNIPTESKITPQDAAAIRGQFGELERQRNQAFTRAAQIAGELEQAKLAVVTAQETIGELKSQLAAVPEKPVEPVPEKPAAGTPTRRKKQA